MRSTWKPSERSLSAFARRHVGYEVRVLLEQVKELARRYPNRITDALGDALLEAFFVHLRLLDDFLGRSGAVPVGNQE